MTALLTPLEVLPTLRYGDTRPAGIRHATVLADMDFETYSEAGFRWNDDTQKWSGSDEFAPKKKGLFLVGAKVYTEHPSFEVLTFKYDLKDGRGVRTWRPGLPNPEELFSFLANGGIVEAWNASFEMHVWAKCEVIYGWPPFPIEQVRCAMAKSRAAARPGGLAKAAIQAGTYNKDAGGKALLDKFSVPRNPTAKNPSLRIRPEDDPVAFAALESYCEDDIKAEFHHSINTPDLSPIELEYWKVDQQINRLGVHVDVRTLEGAKQIVIDLLSRYSAEMAAITGGIEPSKVSQLQGWCLAQGVRLDSMDEENISAALKRQDLPPQVRRALEIRSATASASVKKVFAMLTQRDSRDRLTDLFNFHAARTGRPTGEGPQPTNLPKAGPNVWKCSCGHFYSHKLNLCPWCLSGPLARVNLKGQPIGPDDGPLEWNPDAMSDAIEIIRYGSVKLVEQFFVDVLLTVAGCLRGMFDAAPGHVLVSSDYTAIEAVVLACMAGEQWRIDLFKNKEKIYEKSGSLVTGVPYATILQYKKDTGMHHPARQVGKTAELGLGYQGWVGAWKAFDDSGALSDDEIKAIILKWREKNKAIVEFWGGQSRRQPFGRGLEWGRFGVEGAFIDAILMPGQWHEFRGLYFGKFGSAVYITLPSGRVLTYHDAKLHASSKYGSEYDISFCGWNTNPNNGPVGKWIQFDTWGGRLTENIVQAIANDILRFATVNLMKAGYPVVLHVYDEIVSEIPLGFGSIQEFERIMATLPPWAVLPDGSAWPVGADGGWIAGRYRKG